MMKLILKPASCLLVLFFLLWLPVRIKADHVINVGVYEFKPLIFKDQNQRPSGLFIDVLEHIAQKEGWTLNYIYGTWNDVYQGLLDGKIDLLPCIGITEARKEFVDFADGYIFLDWGVIYSLPGSGIESILDLKNRRIAVLKGSVYTEGLKGMFSQFDIHPKYIEENTYTDVFNAVEVHNADAGISTNLTGIQYEQKFSSKRTPIVFSPVKITYAVKKGLNSRILGVINREVAVLKEDRTSIYYYRYRYWIADMIDEALPSYVWQVGAGLLLLGLILIAWNIILKGQVRTKTDFLNREIDQRKNREEELLESENRLKKVLEILPLGVWIADKNGLITHGNSAGAQIWAGARYVGPDLYGEYKGWWLSTGELIKPEEWGMARAIKSGETSSEEEIEIECFDGTHKIILNWATPIPGKKNEIEGAVVVNQDITARKKSEAEIRTLLEEKNLLLKEVHHRIKNNMNTIKGLLSLQLSSEENPSAAASLHDAECRVQSMIMLYDRLYFTENYREMSVKDYLQSLAEEIVGSFPNRGIVKIEADVEDFILNVNLLTPLGIIVNELITNMMKYAFTGRDSGVLNLSAAIKDNHVTIQVCDNGIGIPESVNFNRSPGFGLDLVRMLVEQIGGEISIERGDGTRFILEFDV